MDNPSLAAFLFIGGDMRNNRPELLGDVIDRIMNKLYSRRQEMCEFFDDFDDFFDGEFMDDVFDDDMEDSMDSDIENDPDHEDEESDELSWSEAYWSGVGLGWFYEDGKWKRQKRRRRHQRSHRVQEWGALRGLHTTK